jgi:hypothetical protein
MAETDRHEPPMYQLRAVLRGSSPLIWRRLLVRSDSTVAKPHEVLQVAFAWGDEHLNRFEIRGREYAVYRHGGGMNNTGGACVFISSNYTQEVCWWMITRYAIRAL